MTDRFAGTAPNPVHVGGTLYVRFADPARAGETVTISIVDTGRGAVVEADIVLDEEGSGSIGWPVPLDWGPFATIEGPGSEDHVVIVTGAPPEPDAPPPSCDSASARSRRARQRRTPPRL